MPQHHALLRSPCCWHLKPSWSRGAKAPSPGAGSTGSPAPSPSPPGLIRTGGPELGKAASQQHYTPGRKCCLCEEFGLLKRACCSLPQRCAPRASTCSLPACLSLLSLGVSKVGATTAPTETTFRAKWDEEAAGKPAGSPGGDLPWSQRVEEAEPELRLQDGCCAANLCGAQSCLRTGASSSPTSNSNQKSHRWMLQSSCSSLLEVFWPEWWQAGRDTHRDVARRTGLHSAPHLIHKTASNP